MSAPAISVVMSNFNCQTFIGKTIDSVLSQTFTDFEFIIIDDCSTDNSREIIDSYKDKRIRKFYLHSNEHMCYGFNLGISKSRGTYIARIDSDDYWEPTKLAKQYAFMQNHQEYGACFTWVNVIDEQNHRLTEVQTDRVALFRAKNREQHEWIRHFYFHGSCLCHPSVLMRVEALKNVGLYNYCLVQIQDYELWVRIAKQYPIHVIEEPLMNYRWFVSGANNSSPTPKIITRSNYEFTYVLSRYFDDIDDEMFVKAFGNDFIHKDAATPDELACERALMLLKPVFYGNNHRIGGMEKLIDLIQRQETREILRHKYAITQKNFYELSSCPIFYENAPLQEYSGRVLLKLLIKKCLRRFPRLLNFARWCYRPLKKNV